MMKKGHSALSLGFLVLSSCASIPKDAPDEFHKADRSVKNLDEIDADTYFPKSVERAETYFSEAKTDFKDSVTDSDRLAATQKASWAKETADDTARLTTKVKSWDENSTAMAGGLAAIEMSETPPQTEVANENSEMSGSELVSTVAYFPTGDDTNPAYSRAELDALVDILSKDETYQVVLTGYADERGSDQINEKLAYERARTIAKELSNRGIKENQLKVESGGSKAAAPKNGDLASLQLQRKVQARVLIQ